MGEVDCSLLDRMLLACLLLGLLLSRRLEMKDSKEKAKGRVFRGRKRCDDDDDEEEERREMGGTWERDDLPPAARPIFIRVEGERPEGKVKDEEEKINR